MSSYWFPKNSLYKWWYGSELYSKPWRTVNWDKSEIEACIREITPSNPNINHVRILLHGPVGAGKTSFINSLNSVFQQRVVTKENAAPLSSTSSTKKYKGCEIKPQTESTNSASEKPQPLKITMFDFKGLQHTKQNVHDGDLTSALHGHLPDGYLFDDNHPMSPDDPNYIHNPTIGEKTHCVVCVVSANTFSLLPIEIIFKMKRFLEEASDHGIPRVVVMTMCDLICPAVKNNLKFMYISKIIKKKMKDCSNKLQIPMTCIFPVKNYDQEINTNVDMDIHLLLALRQIAHSANDYVADLREETSLVE